MRLDDETPCETEDTWSSELITAADESIHARLDESAPVSFGLRMFPEQVGLEDGVSQRSQRR